MAVGRGILDASCPGNVFAAPPADYVYGTTKLLNTQGVLHLVNDYTGDRLAFEIGHELAEADGIHVETVFIDDDVAVQDWLYAIAVVEWPETFSLSEPSAR